jgi:2-polyprenyl-3-methyl-5-hydroxy-6-metoxy-1,4-benzoquinol methylase
MFSVFLNKAAANQMIKKFLLDILVDPITKSNITFHPEKNILTNTNAVQYEVIENVPILLTETNTAVQSDLHDKYNSQFNYKEHYKLDAEYFDYFEEEVFTTKQERARNREAILKKIPAHTKTILDAGCGSAWVAKHFTNTNTNVISMDIAFKNPIEALKNIPNENHTALVADVFNLPIQNNSIDIIVASEILEHLHDPKTFIAELLKVIKPGGKIILITPYNEKRVFHMCVHCNRPTPANAHINVFNEKNIINYLPKQNIQYTTQHFNNKLFTKLRIYNLLSFLPFTIWFGIDKLINKVFKSPAKFLIEITKEA